MRKSRSLESGISFLHTERRMKRIAIQGIAGCFHDTAARNFFDGERIDTLPCPSFDELFARMETDRDLLGIAAIETRSQAACFRTTNCCG